MLISVHVLMESAYVLYHVQKEIVVSRGYNQHRDTWFVNLNTVHDDVLNHVTYWFVYVAPWEYVWCLLQN